MHPGLSGSRAWVLILALPASAFLPGASHLTFLMPRFHHLPVRLSRLCNAGQPYSLQWWILELRLKAVPI